MLFENGAGAAVVLAEFMEYYSLNTDNTSCGVVIKPLATQRPQYMRRLLYRRDPPWHGTPLTFPAVPGL